MNMKRSSFFGPAAAALLFLASASQVRGQDSDLPFSETVDMITEMVRGLSGGGPARSSGHSHYSERSIQLQPGHVPRGAESYNSYGQGAGALPPNYPRYSDEIEPRPSYTSAHAHGGQPCPFCYRVDERSQLCTTEVKFLKNSIALADQASIQYLHNLASALQDPSLARDRFVIEGHASAEGDYETNQILSQQRANAIYDFLVSHGVHPSRLLAVGHGESQARYPSHAAEYLRSTDRRVMLLKLAP